MARHLKLLIYDYVEDVVERREPHRAAHLELLLGWTEEGRIVAGGATGDPPTGALVVFAEDGDPEAFVAADPYVEAGLVAAWRVAPWAVVT